jgi:O-antigen ligase
VRPYWSPELVFLLLFFAHVTAGVAFASDRPVAFDVWSGSFVKIVAITLALAWLAVGPPQFARACRTCVAAGLVVGAVALWNKLHGINLVEGTRVTIGREVDSILADPNDLALVLLFPASFALGLFCTRGLHRLDRLFGLSTFLVLTLAILATQSRGGLLGLVAVLAPFVRRRIRSNLVLIALFGLFAAALFAAAQVGDRTLLANGTGEELDESAQNRLWAWETGLNMALANPLNGVGIGTFEANYFFYTEHWLGRDYVAHSTWFQVLGETGFPGLLIYVTMIGLGTGHLLRADRRLRAAAAAPFARALAISLLAGLAGFVAAGTFLSQAFNWPIYVILALGAAVSHHAAGIGVANRNTQPGFSTP